LASIFNRAVWGICELRNTSVASMQRFFSSKQLGEGQRPRNGVTRNRASV
jgi:hypothetical protein